jgi:hypothetical protein
VSKSRVLRIFDALDRAYSGLLDLPFGHPARLGLQGAMATLRDAIAAMTAEDSGTVQCRYEDESARRTRDAA